MNIFRRRISSFENFATSNIKIRITSKLFIKQRAYECEEPVTQEIMGQIAEEEAEVAAAKNKRSEPSSQTTAENEVADDDNYDYLVSLSLLIHRCTLNYFLLH